MRATDFPHFIPGNSIPIKRRLISTEQGGGRPWWGWVSLQLLGFMGLIDQLKAPRISGLQNVELNFGVYEKVEEEGMEP